MPHLSSEVRIHRLCLFFWVCKPRELFIPSPFLSLGQWCSSLCAFSEFCRFVAVYIQAHQMYAKPHFSYPWRCIYGAGHMVKMWGSLGIPMGQLGNSQERHPPHLIWELPDVNSFQNLCPFDVLLELWLLFSQLICTFSQAAPPQCSGWWKNSESLKSVLHCWRNLVLTHIFILSHGKSQEQEDPSWHWAVLP